MKTRMTTVGFGAMAKPSGKPAEVPTPKVYDFTNGKRPVIPEEERSDAPSAAPQPTDTVLPQPPVFDGDRQE